MNTKGLLIIFLLSIIFKTTYSQEAEYRSILDSGNDTSKVQNLIDYGRRYMTSDTVIAKTAFDQAIHVSKLIGYHQGAGQSWISIGYMQAQSGAYREAIESYYKSIVEWKRLKSLDKLTKCLNTIGTLYDFLGRRDSAIIAYMQSAKLLEGTDELASLGSTYNYIGILHNNSGNYFKAAEYQEKAVRILRNATDTAFLIEALTELNDTYVAMKKPQLAIQLSREALPLAQTINRTNTDRSVLATVYYSLALSHLELQEFDSAISEARLCVSNALASGDLNTYGGGALVLSDCYQRLGKDTERYDVLMNAIDVCNKTGNVLLIQYTYERLADAAYRLNKHQQAIAHHKKYVQYKDSVFNQKNANIISELEVKYQTAEKEKSLSTQRLSMAEKEVQLQMSHQMTLYSVSLAIVACFITMFVYLHFRGKRKLHQKHLQSIQQEKEIHLLQAIRRGEEKERGRIAKDLHDGVAGMLAAVKMHFSSIALNIGDVVQAEGYQQGIHLLDEASQEVRKTSHNLMPELLLRHGLDEAVRRYCNNVSNSSKLLIQYDSIGEAGRFVDSFELSVYRIVQELLNNIVKHSNATEAIVQITFQSEVLAITIEDNGRGFTGVAHANGETGLGSLQSRISAMNGRMELDADGEQGLNAYLEFDTTGLEKSTLTSLHKNM